MTAFKPTKIILERLPDGKASQEERVIHTTALLADIALQWVRKEDLDSYKEVLVNGALLPIGSVSFIREALLHTGITEPENLSYPVILEKYLHRHIEQRAAGSVKGRHFVKPVRTKAFTGCVFDTSELSEALCPHDRLQYQAFTALPSSAPVWVSEVVSWQNEARYYVLNGDILGIGPYGEYPEEAPEPNLAIVHEMVLQLTRFAGFPRAFALDVGVLQSGETALVECNDAWALGYYKGTLNASRYLELLSARWDELLASRAQS